jgi:mevalonate pyrophosphate decarboxylase
MTGDSGLIVMTEDSLRIIRKVRKLRDDGLKAYYSMQTGPSVFINTTGHDQQVVLRAMAKLGYRAYLSSVGGEARIL